MAKRMTATEKWNDPWFSELSVINKLFWLYLLDNCNHAGIWEYNERLLKFHLGSDFEIDKVAFKDKIKEYKPGKYFISNFVDFQYGELKEENRAHLSVMSLLKKEGVYKPLKSPLQGDKDKDKDKDCINIKISSFESFWKAYPKKVGKDKALESWKKQTVDLDVVLKALEWQVKTEQWTKDGGQFIPNPATYLNQGRWKDEPQKGISAVVKPRQPDMFDDPEED